MNAIKNLKNVPLTGDIFCFALRSRTAYGSIFSKIEKHNIYSFTYW